MENMISNFHKWRTKNHDNFSTAINYLFIAYAFFIPITEKPTNLILLIIFMLYLLEGSIKEKLLYALKNNFIRAIILFFLIHIIWLYSSDNKTFAMESIRNISVILYIIIYMGSIKKEFIFKILSGFLFAMMFSEIASYLIYFQIIDPFNNATVSDPVPFALSHTQYSLYLSLSMGILLYIASDNSYTKYIRMLYSLFFITATANIFIISSRVGFILYMVNILLVLFVIYKQYIFKYILISLVLLITGYSLAYNFSHTFKTRSEQTFINLNKVLDEKNYSTATGIRIGYWVYSLDVIKSNFIFGVGDGDQITSVKNNILRLDHNKSNIEGLLCSMQNGLHSDLLDILVKFGFIGLLVYLNVFYQLYNQTPQDKIFNVVKILLISTFILGGLQGGVILLRDFAKLFTLLGVLIIISQNTPLPSKNNFNSLS